MNISIPATFAGKAPPRLSVRERIVIFAATTKPLLRPMKSAAPFPPRLPESLSDRSDADAFLHEESISQLAFRSICFPPVLREHVAVEQCTLRGCLLPGFGLRHAQWSDVEVRNCDLTAADLSGCGFQRVSFIDCKFSGANFARTHLLHVRMVRCKAEAATFAASRLRHVRFEECILQGASLSDCRMEDTGFERCDLTDAEFFGTRLQGISLADSEIRGIRIREVASPELRGARIGMHQALDLVRLLGVEIEE